MASPPLNVACLLSLCLLSILHVNATGGFTVDLIHRDSPKSPLYNPSLSSFDRLRAAAGRSRSRADFFRLMTTDGNGTSSFDSEVIPNQFEYLMTIHVGTPPFKILAIADTGSDLTWTQCQPCVSCYKQKDPIFDAKSSSTYRTLGCNTDTCAELPEAGCSTKASLCEYRYTYGDNSYTNGILSAETFTFHSEGQRNVSIPKVLFGCSHESKGTFDGAGGGLVGLGGGPLSIVSQLGSSIDNKFSHCLVPYSNQDNATSVLNFGDGADVGGENVVTTPIIKGEVDTFYFLSLEDISVGDEKVVVAAKSAAIGEGNIIIDSGTTLTMLDDAILKPVVEKLSEVVKLPRTTDPDGLFNLCFDVSTAAGNFEDELPDLTFGFSGAPVKLPPLNTFVMVQEGVLCLALVSSGGLGMAIYGNIAQQNFHIGYDLGAGKLSFAPTDCAKL